MCASVESQRDPLWPSRPTPLKPTQAHTLSSSPPSVAMLASVVICGGASLADVARSCCVLEGTWCVSSHRVASAKCGTLVNRHKSSPSPWTDHPGGEAWEALRPWHRGGTSVLAPPCTGALRPRGRDKDKWSSSQSQWAERSQWAETTIDEARAIVSCRGGTCRGASTLVWSIA